MWYRWPAEDKRILSAADIKDIEAWRDSDTGELRWLAPGGNPNNRQYTDEELDAIKHARDITMGDWERMTPAQKLKEQGEWLARLWANDGVINLMDPLDPAWAKKDTEREEDTYRTERSSFGG